MVCYFVLCICFVRIFVIVCICLYVYLYVWIQDTTEQHCLLMWSFLSKYFNYNYNYNYNYGRISPTLTGSDSDREDASLFSLTSVE